MLLSRLPLHIITAMLDDPRTCDTTHSISVAHDQGIVTLSGQVPTEKIRQAAEEIARETRGVVYVHNDLIVEKRPTSLVG